MGWSQDEVGKDDRGAFVDELTWCPARDHGLKEKRPDELSHGRKSSMITGYVKGARNVNRKSESESHFVGRVRLLRFLARASELRRTAKPYARADTDGPQGTKGGVHSMRLTSFA